MVQEDKLDPTAESSLVWDEAMMLASEVTTVRALITRFPLMRLT